MRRPNTGVVQTDEHIGRRGVARSNAGVPACDPSAISESPTPSCVGTAPLQNRALSSATVGVAAPKSGVGRVPADQKPHEDQSFIRAQYALRSSRRQGTISASTTPPGGAADKGIEGYSMCRRLRLQPNVPTYTVLRQPGDDARASRSVAVPGRPQVADLQGGRPRPRLSRWRSTRAGWTWRPGGAGAGQLDSMYSSSTDANGSVVHDDEWREQELYGLSASTASTRTWGPSIIDEGTQTGRPPDMVAQPPQSARPHRRLRDIKDLRRPHRRPAGAGVTIRTRARPLTALVGPQDWEITRCASSPPRGPRPGGEVRIDTPSR